MQVLEVVVFEESGEERMVLGLCRLCEKSWPTPEPHHYAVVSPRGTAHVAEDYGMTACGRDGTGAKWWWKL